MKQKKGIVYIVTKLELGGAQKVCVSLFEQIPDHEYATFLISGNQGFLAKTIVEKQNVFLLESFKREVSIFTLVHEFKTFAALVKQLKQLRREYPTLIVHTHSTKAGLMGRFAAYIARANSIIHTVHGFGFHPFQNKIAWFIHYFLELLISFLTDHYVCVSAHDAAIGSKLLPFFKRKHSIIRAAVDDAFFLPAVRIHKKENASFTFGTIACFKKQKNVFDLLHAFKRVHETCNNVCLELIGDGHLRTAIEQWIIQHHLQHYITLHGWQDNVLPYLQRWDAFVLTSLWEGLPCAVVEARLLKLPVISYNTGGIAEIIQHEKNGLLYKPKAWRKLARGMQTLVQNKSLKENLVQQSDDFHAFSTSAMIQAHKNLYEIM
jgi:glycosyltransferase involved in cell wall biosynthesis